MESWSRLFLLSQALTIGLLCMSWQGSAQAQSEADPEIAITPLVKPKAVKPARIDTENFEIGAYFGILNVENFGSNSVTGVRLAYHVTEDVFIETAFGKSDTKETSAERLNGAFKILTEEQRKLEYYNISLGFNILPGEAFISSEYSFHTALYLIGGAGSTKFAGDDRRTINFGFGYRAIMNDWLTIHLDARDHIFDIDLLGSQITSNNIEFHTGITMFF
ncbi:outer membrane beta-barrel domain-containing protein [Pseudomonadota bacterium]